MSLKTVFTVDVRACLCFAHIDDFVILWNLEYPGFIRGRTTGQMFSFWSISAGLCPMNATISQMEKNIWPNPNKYFPFLCLNSWESTFLWSSVLHVCFFFGKCIYAIIAQLIFQRLNQQTNINSLPLHFLLVMAHLKLNNLFVTRAFKIINL